MKILTLRNTNRRKNTLFKSIQYVLLLWASLFSLNGNAETMEWTIVNSDHSISSIFITDDCDNATDGGQIQGDETGCDDPFFDPSPITNVVMPSGGTGAIEFIWISTTDDPDDDFVVWTPISGSTDPFYDPGPITQTTYFMRCARREGCIDYVAESNPVKKEIRCCENITNGGIVLEDQDGCGPVYDPETLTNLIEPSGGTGDIEYLWFQSTVGPPFLPDSPDWTEVPNSNSPNYDPLSITQTTYFIRCARRVGCTTYTGESNIIIISIQAGPELSSIITTLPSCNGLNDGHISVEVIGGDAPFTYEWSNGAPNSSNLNNISAGDYGLTITNSTGCSNNFEINLPEPPTLIVEIESTTLDCGGGATGTATATPSGGAAPYTYLWSDENAQTTATATGLSAGNYFVQVTDANACTITMETIIENIGNLGVNITPTPVQCIGESNGAATAMGNGGMPPYNYEWSNGETTATIVNLATGSYALTVSDQNDCSTSTTISINEPEELMIDVHADMATCLGANDGTGHTTVSGGTPPYTYQWNDAANQTTATASNLVAGIYMVTVTDANACFKIESINIEAEDGFNIAFDKVDVNCADGSLGAATVNPDSGTAPYTYQWDDINMQTTATALDLNSGTYTVTVTDANACAAIGEVIIGITGDLNINIDKTNLNCSDGNDGTANVTVNSGTAPFQYEWSNGATTANIDNLTLGTYMLTVTDANACTAISSVDIEAENPMLLELTKVDATCDNLLGTASVQVSNGTAPYTYAWNDANNQTTATANNLMVGTYIVMVTDANNCTAEETVTIGVAEEFEVMISVIPAPCTGEQTGSATATATNGAAPYTYQWNDINMQTTATANSLAIGDYIVIVTDANGCEVSKNVSIVSQNDLQIEFDIVNVSCHENNDGGVTATVSGGLAPYTYLWENGATTAILTNLFPGNYDVTVIDANGCEIIETATINKPAALELNLSNTHVNCTDGTLGTATVMVTGGTMPYTYIWDDTNAQTTATASNLMAGTYTVTVTDANACTQIDMITIESVGDFDINFETTNNSCADNQDAAITALPSSGLAPYTYQWDTGGTTSTITGLTPGDYEVTVTDANGCEVVATGTISEADALQLTLSGTNLNCNLGILGTATATVMGGTAPYTYTWDDENMQTTVTATDLVLGTYTVVVTDANGCTVSSMITIESVGDFDINFETTNNSCSDMQDGSITANPSGGLAPYTYQWDTGGTTSTITGLTPGDYEVTVTDANGCEVVATGTISEADALQLTLSGTNVNCNQGILGTATAAVMGGTAPYTYTWDDENTQTTATATNLVVGTYTVVVTDANGCTVSSMITIESVGDFDINFESTSNSCSDMQDGSITANPSGGLAPYTYQWDTGGTTSTITGLTPGDYEVMVTDANGCEVVATGTISEADALQLTLSGTNINCENGTLGTATATVMGGTAPYTYTWDDENTQTTATATNLVVGTYTVVVADANGCTVSSMITIETVGDFSINFESTSNSCSDMQDGSITASPSGGLSPYTYQWSTGGTSATISGLAPGNYDVTVTDANGCDVEATGTIDETDALQLTLTGSNINCTEATMGSATANVMGGTMPYTYIWDDENAQTTATATGLEIGTYTVIITDANGCTVSSMITIETVGNFDVLINSTNLSCPDSNDGAAQSTVNGAEAPFTYEWSNGAMTADLISLSPGIYSLTVTDANGCTGIADVTITEPNPLELTVDATDASCDGLAGRATASTIGGTAPYTYFWSDPNMQTTATATNLSSGTYTVIVTDANDCTTAEEVTIGLSGTLDVNINASSTNICEGGAVQLSTNPSGSEYTYVWTATGGNFDNSTASNPIYTVSTAGTYTISVQIMDEQGCQGSAMIEVTVNSQPSINISPNNAGICSGSPIEFRTLPTLANHSYTWTASGGSFDNANSPTPTYTMLTPGTYTINVTVVSPDGCSTISSTTVTVNENPSCSAGVDAQISVRGGADGQASVNVFDGTGPYSFEWSNGDLTQDITGLGAGTYTVTVTDALGCFCTSSVTLNNPAKLGDFVWEDSDRDGIQDENESGIPNVQVILTGTDILGNPVMDTTFTDANGMYMFNGLEAGTYKVTFATPEDHSPSDANVGDDEALDSDADPITGMTEMVDLDYGEYNSDLDAGFYSNTVNIGDYVWFDLDRDGIQDANEGGVQNVQILLIDLGPDQIYGTADDMTIMSTFTDFSGHYLFTDVPPGKYVIQFHPFSLPNGSIFTAANQGSDDALDSDANEDGVTQMFMVMEEQMDDLTFDAGIYQKCDNITDGGSIDGNEFVCGAGTNPSIITNVELPSGGFGNIEYLWMVSTTSAVFTGPNDPDWQVIPGATGPEYDPDVIFTTTYYARCARRECCITYFETDVVTKYVSSFPPANIADGPSSICTNETATYTATFVGNSTSYAWDFGVDASPATFNGRIAPDVSWSSIGNKTVTLTTNMNGCESSTTMNVQVANCFAPLGQFDGLKGQLMNEEYVMLRWNTSIEPADSRFIIERADINQEKFYTLDLLKGHGGEEVHSYELKDHHPLLGHNYYRIKHMDANGNYVFSETVSVFWQPQTIKDVHVFPNPFREKTTLQVLSPLEEEGTIQIVSAYGQVLEILPLAADTHQLELDFSKYPKGLYVIYICYNRYKKMAYRLMKTDEE